MKLAKLYPRNKKKKKSWKMVSFHKESNVFMETLDIEEFSFKYFD